MARRVSATVDRSDRVLRFVCARLCQRPAMVLHHPLRWRGQQVQPHCITKSCLVMCCFVLPHGAGSLLVVMVPTLTDTDIDQRPTVQLIALFVARGYARASLVVFPKQ